MSGVVRVAAGSSGDVSVVPGPRLLAGVGAGPSLGAHRTLWPEPAARTATELLALLESTWVAGRGGAGFPFARKVSAAVAAGRRREVVVNAAEGEPASAKDSALLLTAPHLVLDGAELVARALGVRTVHVVHGDRPAVERALRRAVRERAGGPRIRLHRAEGYVGGQERAVLELLEGRANLPVTAWQPAAVRGLRGRPTVLSNAETFAQVAALGALGGPGFAALGAPEEPGTCLLTVTGNRSGTTVLEVPFGVPIGGVLGYAGHPPGPAILGGYQGAWLTADETATLRLLTSELRTVGATPGAGVLLPLEPGGCPVRVTAAIVTWLAGRSAGRCGPCRLGLPELARATGALALGAGAPADVDELAALVTGRGACAHPDGTARLVRSLLDAFPDEAEAHAAGSCAAAAAEALA